MKQISDLSHPNKSEGATETDYFKGNPSGVPLSSKSLPQGVLILEKLKGSKRRAAAVLATALLKKLCKLF